VSILALDGTPATSETPLQDIGLYIDIDSTFSPENNKIVGFLTDYVSPASDIFVDYLNPLIQILNGNFLGAASGSTSDLLATAPDLNPMQAEQLAGLWGGNRTLSADSGAPPANALQGRLSSQMFHPISSIADNTLRVEDRKRTADDGAGGGGNFYLKINGRDFLVRGATYTPDLLYNYDPDRDEAILRYAKDLGVNMLRLESKISSARFIELADEMGIPLMYGWMCCNQWEKWQQWDDEDRRVASDSLRSQIEILRSHPSVFVWANGSDGRPPEDLRKAYRTIIDDLLALSRIEQAEGMGDLPLEQVPVADVLAAVVAECRPRADERSITIEVDSPPALGAEVNAPLLEQALINLVDNALKYSEPGGRVVVAVAPTVDGMLEWLVRDQGSGIGAEHLPRLFERFYRVDKGRSRRLGGTGLGLSIVKHIVQAHGGTVAVESTPGVGSTFRVFLPVSRG
jgi:two-component sensor histidine kinase